MLLVILCLAVSVLIYVRTRIVDRMRRNRQQQQPHEEQQRPAPDGVFHPPVL